MTPRVREILDWYRSEPPGVLARLAALFNHGSLAGTGKLSFISQSNPLLGGPEQKFAVHKDSYDPHYQMNLGSELKASGYCAHIGSIEVSWADFAGEFPLILELNQWDKNDQLVQMASVEKALQLGCTAIKINIPVNLLDKNLAWLQEQITEAKKYGLPVIVSALARGDNFSDSNYIDLISAYCNKVVQVGAHILNICLPENKFSQKNQEKLFMSHRVKVHRAFDRVKHILNVSFAGKRIVLFSLNETLNAEEVLSQVKEIARGGGFGTIVSSELWFKYSMQEAIDLNKKLLAQFKG